MIADGTGKHYLVPGANAARIHTQIGKWATNACSSDVHAVCLAALDNFSVASYHSDTCATQRIRHGTHLSFENRRWKTFLQHKGDNHRVAFGTGDCKVVHSAI